MPILAGRCDSLQNASNGPGQTRTVDLTVISGALYQLSYRPSGQEYSPNIDNRRLPIHTEFRLSAQIPADGCTPDAGNLETIGQFWTENIQ